MLYMHKNRGFTGLQLGAFWKMYCYSEFKLRYLDNLKLFSTKVKELFEPIYIVLQRNADGLLLFLKALSWETDLWVTLRNFTVKNPKLGGEICIQLNIK